MLLINCNIIYLDRIEKGAILIKNGKITEFNPTHVSDDIIIDCDGLYVSPGFIDIHIHGAGGFDTMDGNFESINEISKTLCKFGVTSFTPTTMTMTIEDILKSLQEIKKAKEKGTDGSQVIGAHLEGPFISPKSIGAQNPMYIIEASYKNFERLVGDSIDIIKTITMAPEIEGVNELASILASKGIRCSIGHSSATYKEALDGINSGFCHATHLFNAMSGFSHREPGVVGAVFDSDITAEIICDGVHISYPSLRVACKQKGVENMILVTDAMCACGLGSGIYSLGGQSVIVKDSEARLENGALAGSVLTLNKAVKNIYSNSKYELYEVIRMATYNPAKHCRVENKKGLVKVGYDADLVIFDKDINVKMTIVKGNIIYNDFAPKSYPF